MTEGSRRSLAAPIVRARATLRPPGAALRHAKKTGKHVSAARPAATFDAAGRTSRFLVAQRADWIRGRPNAQAVETVAPGDVLEVQGFQGRWVAVRLYYASRDLLRKQDTSPPAPARVKGASVTGWVNLSTVQTSRVHVVFLAGSAPPAVVEGHARIPFSTFARWVPALRGGPAYYVQYLPLACTKPFDLITFRGGDSGGTTNRDLQHGPDHQTNSLIGLLVPYPISPAKWSRLGTTFQRRWVAWSKKKLRAMPSWDPVPGKPTPEPPSRGNILHHYGIPRALLEYNAERFRHTGKVAWSRPGYQSVIQCSANGTAWGGIGYLAPKDVALPGEPSPYQIAGSEFSVAGAGTKHWWPAPMRFVWEELNPFLAFLTPAPMGEGEQTGARRVQERALALQAYVAKNLGGKAKKKARRARAARKKHG